MFRTRHGTNYYYVKNVTVTDPTNWNRYTVTIPGNSNLQIDDATTTGMDFFFTYYSGPDKDTSSEGSWGSTNAYSTSESTNYFDSTSNDMFITGIQLEVGDTATSFEHRSFGDELSRCQRYFYKVTGDSGARVGIGGCCVNSTEFRMNVTFPVTMRALPTISGTGTAQMDAANDSVNFNCSIVTIESAPTGLISSLGLQAVTSGMVSGQGGNLRFRSNGSS